MQSEKTAQSLIYLFYMARNINPKCKQCRRIGEKLFLKGERCNTSKCAIVKRNYVPGLHGPKGMKGKQSSYGLQLAEKQKAKKQYHLMEKQFRLTFNRAVAKTGDRGENFLRLLEKRLDNVIYRAGFARSRSEARQIVLHRHFEVNERRISIPSYEVKTGDIIKLSIRGRKAKIFSGLSQSLKKHQAPAWLNLEPENSMVKVLNDPSKDDLANLNINVHVIVEHYSK